MLYVLIVCNIILSLFILSVIISFCYNIKFLDRIFDRITKSKRLPLLLVAVLVFLVLVFSTAATEQMWINKYWVSVDAVVTNSTISVDRTNYGDDEFGHDDVEYTTRYKITYEFHYNDKTYQITQTRQDDRLIGTIESIKINPNNPQNDNVFATSIVVALISVGGWLIVLRLLIGIFKK